MKKYYVNEHKQDNGDHEVHIDTCEFYAKMKNKQYLGEYTTCVEAVAKAKKEFEKANGCCFCCNSCHTT